MAARQPLIFEPNVQQSPLLAQYSKQIYSPVQGLAELAGNLGSTYLQNRKKKKEEDEAEKKNMELVRAYQMAADPGMRRDQSGIVYSDSDFSSPLFDQAKVQSAPLMDANQRGMRATENLARKDPAFALQSMGGLMQAAQGAEPPSFTGALGPGQQAFVKGKQVASVPEKQSDILNDEAFNREKALRAIAPPQAPTQPRNVQYVTTKDGIFVLKPDGTLGNRLGDAPSSSRPLSAVEQREMFEAEDGINAGTMAVEALNRAQALNDKAASGPGARIERAYDRVMNPDEAAASAQFNTEILDQALSALKATFGGMPTEGERKVLLEMQAAPNMTRAERKALLARALLVTNRRMEMAKTRLAKITGSPQGGGPPGDVDPAVWDAMTEEERALWPK